MNRMEASEQLSAYLDGELTDVEAAELERELTRDPGLRAELDELKGAVDFLRVHGPAQAPVNLYGNVLRAVENEPIPGAWWRWWMRPFGIPVQALAVAAVALLIVVVALNVGGQVMTSGALLTRSDQPSSGKADLEQAKEAPPPPPPPPEVATAPTTSATYGDEQSPKEKSPPKKKMSTTTKGGDTGLRSGAPKAQAQGLAETEEQQQAANKLAVIQGSGTTSTGSAEAPTASTQSSQSYKTMEGKNAEVLHATEYSVVLDTTDPDSMMALKKLAVRYKGDLYDLKGRALKPTSLEPGTATTFSVRIPATMLSDFVGDLRRYGMVRESSTVKSTDLFAGDQVQVEVTVNVSEVAPKAAAPAVDSLDNSNEPGWDASGKQGL